MCPASPAITDSSRMAEGSATQASTAEEPWDDWWPEEQTALDAILAAESKKAALEAAHSSEPHDAEEDDEDDWHPTAQGAAEDAEAQPTMAENAEGDKAEEDDDEWAPAAQGAANVEASEAEALKALLVPTHLIERERAKQPFDSKREADSAGRQLTELKRQPTVVEAKQMIPRGPGVDVDSLPEPEKVVMSEEEGIALVRRGASIDFNGQHGRCPLHKAAESAHPLLCEAICDAGGKVDTRDKFGETPLLLLAHVMSQEEPPAEDRRRDTIRILLSMRADVHAVNPRGRGVLHLAGVEGDQVALEMFIEAKADLNAQDAAGFTPLMWAAGRNCVPVVKMLLDRGADANIKAVRGQTALTFALTNGNDAVVDVLERHQMILDQAPPADQDLPVINQTTAEVHVPIASPCADEDANSQPADKCPQADVDPFKNVYSKAKPDMTSNVYIT